MEEEKTPEFSDLAKMMADEHSILMDINHEAMQYARECVQRLREIEEAFSDHIEELVQLHITKAMTMTKIAEDLIMAEFDEDSEGTEDVGEDE